jgi:hypothetical protein
MVMKAEYKEGPEARDKFEAAMKTLFKARKEPKKKKPPRAATSDKPDAADKD